MAYPNLEKLLTMSQEDIDGIEYDDRVFPSGDMRIYAEIRETRPDDWGNPEWTGAYVPMIAPFDKFVMDRLAGILLSGEPWDSKLIFRDTEPDNITG